MPLIKSLDSLSGDEKSRLTDRPLPGSRASSTEHRGAPLGRETAWFALNLLCFFRSLKHLALSPRLTPTQEPAVIEPGTLIIGISKEGILHQLQLCGGQEGMGLHQHSRILDIPTALQPKSHLYPGLTQELHMSVRSRSSIRWFRAGLDRHQDWGGPEESLAGSSRPLILNLPNAVTP